MKIVDGKSNIKTGNSDIVSEWHPTKNGKLKLTDVSEGSYKKVWWRCSEGHEWEAAVCKRNQGNGCPVCANKRILQGYNDLQTLNPELADEWNYEKNGKLRPTDISIGSNKKVWWRCSKDHEWEAIIYSRNSGIGCPFCSNRKVLCGFNDLATVNPELTAEWNYEKNGELKPTDVVVGSAKKVWWRCSEGHEWVAAIVDRNNGRTCPYCTNRKVLQGYNDLQTVNPQLALEWNYEKNGELKPTDIVAGTGKKVWWKCLEGHEWNAIINDRNRGNGCPYCTNKKVLQGYNDLQTVNPELATEWNYEKNGVLKPTDVTAGREKKVWWRCSKGHEWKAYIDSRNRGIGCPVCSSEMRTSFPEFAIFYYLKKIDESVIHSFSDFSFELDIYIPDKKIGIEYDGYFWHKDKQTQDKDKNSKCNELGITLYRFRENQLGVLNDLSIDIITNQNSLDKDIANLILEIYKISVDVDIDRDTTIINNMREYLEKEQSLMLLNPNLASEWNAERNGKFRPNMVTSGSGRRVWWRCNKGHEWKAAINSRNRGSGCPYCLNKAVLKGFNDLATVNPILASEWNYEKNGILNPDMVVTNSNKKVWWIGKCGHEWEAKVSQRNRGGGCPVCSRNMLLQGFNDLQTINPDLATEWNYGKNGGLKPIDVMAGSNKRVWWIGKCGHEWEAAVCKRNKGGGCPVCAGKIVLQGFNDLQTIHPDLASEWNYEKNRDLRPTNVTAENGKKVWWKCLEGHEWEATVHNRAKGNGCPYCSNKAVLKGFNDLLTVNSALVSEWHPTKNNDLKPTDVTVGSNKKVWWKCSEGHEWKAIIYNRVNGKGCPYCSNKVVLEGFNDLQTVNLALASEWHPTKNNDLKPTDVTAGSNKKVWWKCSKGHEWEATVHNRARGNGCPICMGKKVLKGFNDLQTINPTLASEWHPTKNNDLKPTDVTAGSNKKVWWKCSEGHEWETFINNRKRGNVCPECRKKKSKMF